MWKKNLFLITALASLLLINVSAVAAQSQQIYLIKISYQQGDVEIADVSIKQGFVPAPERLEEMNPDRYVVQLSSFSGEVLEERMFSIPLQVVSEPPKPGESVILEEEVRTLETTDHLVILSYHQDGKEIKLYNSDKSELLDETNISYLAQVCGDGVCQEHENYIECRNDCPTSVIADGVCDDKIFFEDPDCYSEPIRPAVNDAGKTEPPSGLSKTMIVIGIIILLAVVITIGFVVKNRRSGPFTPENQ
ncbi:MAG: hypothetical protein Q8Q23_01530 [bacterium]|nr:hypothetical protein [bacterium]